MANIIKGLTVEIGGDTTKLGKALEDVNKRSRDLSSELGQINKLLKLDPGNADLLAQKQKVLAEAIENTGEKLDKLKQAEKQVQEQFERGEASEEQVRALQREIVATAKKMETYERAAKETADAIEHLGDGSEEAEDGLKGTGDEAKKAAKKVDDFADAADKAEKSGEGMGKTLASAAKAGLAAIGAAAGAAITGLVAAAESSREYRTEMGKLNTAFTQNGHSSEVATQTYQALQGVLGETDQAVEAANHLAKLTDNEEDLAKWSGDILPGVFATFGASLPIEGLTEAANETAKTGALTGSLADALNWAGVSEDEFQEKLDKCNTEQERQALITETLTGLYGEASKAYKEQNAEVIRANQANEAWMASMAGVGGAIEPIITDVKMLGASMMDELVPYVQDLAGAFRDLMGGDLAAAGGIGEALSEIINTLLFNILEMAPAMVDVATSLVTSLSTTLISLLPRFVGVGAQLIVKILNGITSAIPQLVTAFTNMVPVLVTTLVSNIPQLMDGALSLFMAIVEAVPVLIAALVPQIPTIVLAVINALIDRIPDLLDGAFTLFCALLDAIPMIIVELTKAVPSIVATIVKALSTLPAKIWDVFKKVVAKVLEWRKEMITKGKECATTLITTVVNALKGLPQKVLTVGKDLVTGLWNGINNKLSWLKNKIKSFTNSVLDGIKSFFGVHSPSTETAWIGEMLDEGLAQGVTDAAKVPVKAMQRVSGSVLSAAQGDINGLQLQRSLSGHTYGGAAAASAAGGNASLLAKLDGIYERLGRLQIVLDTGTLVGETLDKIDAGLAGKQLLAARGV